MEIDIRKHPDKMSERELRAEVKAWREKTDTEWFEEMCREVEVHKKRSVDDRRTKLLLNDRIRRVLKMISKESLLSHDHEPDVDDLWDLLRRIEGVFNG